MAYVETLITTAERKAGTCYRLHKATGISEQALSAIKAGELGMSPAIAARLAAYVGADPREVALAALVAKERTPEKRAELARLLRIATTAPAALVLALGALSPNISQANQPLTATDRAGSVYYVN